MKGDDRNNIELDVLNAAENGNASSSNSSSNGSAPPSPDKTTGSESTQTTNTSFWGKCWTGVTAAAGAAKQATANGAQLVGDFAKSKMHWGSLGYAGTLTSVALSMANVGATSWVARKLSLAAHGTFLGNTVRNAHDLEVSSDELKQAAGDNRNDCVNLSLLGDLGRRGLTEPLKLQIQNDAQAMQKVIHSSQGGESKNNELVNAYRYHVALWFVSIALCAANAATIYMQDQDNNNEDKDNSDAEKNNQTIFDQAGFVVDIVGALYTLYRSSIYKKREEVIRDHASSINKTAHAKVGHFNVVHGNLQKLKLYNGELPNETPEGDEAIISATRLGDDDQNAATLRVARDTLRSYMKKTLDPKLLEEYEKLIIEAAKNDAPAEEGSKRHKTRHRIASNRLTERPPQQAVANVQVVAEEDQPPQSHRLNIN
jgi:hypothetical protein